MPRLLIRAAPAVISAALAASGSLAWCASTDEEALATARAILDRGDWREGEAQLGALCEAWKREGGRPAARIHTCDAAHAEALSRIGRPDAAAEKAGKLLEQIGTGPDATVLRLGAMQSLALARLVQGRSREAAQVAGSVWEERGRLLGQRHPDTLRSLNTYSVALRNLGEIDRAIDLQQSLLAALEEVRGPDHEDTLRVRGNLALALTSAGRLSEGEDRYRELLAVRTAKNGPKHPANALRRHRAGEFPARIGTSRGSGCAVPAPPCRDTRRVRPLAS